MLDFIAKNIRHLVTQWLLKREGSDYPRYYNLVNNLWWKYPFQLGWDDANRQMFVEDSAGRLYFCRKSRVNRYRKGIDNFLDKLAKEYMIDGIPFAEGDCVVDCGANVGEVSRWVLRGHPSVRAIAVEPEAREADCADLNLFGGRRETVRKALWNEETVLEFFQKGETADSTVFEIEGYTAKVSVEATTLDRVLRESGVSRIRLLKLEAEGAEPEILLGCEQHLGAIDYIAADCGPERGLNQVQTATPVINFLLQRNFDLVDMKFDRVVCLFRNRNVRDA